MSHPSVSFPGLFFLFDLDGVIVDSMPMHNEAWRIYLNKRGLTPDARDIDSTMHGRRNDEIVRHFFGAHLTIDEIEAHGAEKELLFRDMMNAELERHLVPGVREFLSETTDVPAAVVSNAERSNIDFVLDGAGLRWRFQAVVDGHQVAHAKPAPDLYLKAAELLGAPLSQCVVFEDSPAGIAAGRASGACVIGVATHPAIHTNELPKVDLVIQDFRDPVLVPWLSGIAAAVK
ncbi:MAG TPA: HAD family phosphatase [Bryobacteraceae bacterium]|nr:HAD family phosphatase [Bryobacteraceae bacterium]